MVDKAGAGAASSTLTSALESTIATIRGASDKSYVIKTKVTVTGMPGASTFYESVIEYASATVFMAFTSVIMTAFAFMTYRTMVYTWGAL